MCSIRVFELERASEIFFFFFFLPCEDLVLVGIWSWQQGAKREPTTEGDWRQQGKTGHETVNALAYAN